ncbi:YitT family protein [Bacillus sp. 03113]|uniref:YitT family protein n=1 Tax=Bacillus sp. 03113 TaxID=2578211 RepID=UPI001142A09C|nr:YitT family protein [Bacillus sp. 03113]
MFKLIKDLFFLLTGSFLFAIGINMFVIPLGLGEGGVTGLSLIFYYLFEISPAISNIVLNGLLLIVGYKFLDKKTMIYTIIAVASNSIFLHLTEGWSVELNESIIGVIFSGAIIGAGIGLVVRVGGTTAGSTILARIAQKYLDWNISYSLLFIDLVVVAFTYFIIGAEKLLFTILMLYIGTKVMDFVIEGLNTKKAVTIISSNKNDIANEINHRLDRGVTILNGKGNYSQESKEILYVVINKQELLRLKKMIKKIDPTAFVIIHDVRDVFGKGFLDI